MGIFTSKIIGLKEEQKTYTRLQKMITSEVSKLEVALEGYIESRCKEVFGEIKIEFSPGLEYGCLAANWVPCVYFYSVEELEHCEGNFYELSQEEHEPYTLSAKKMKNPIPMTKFKRFIKEMEKETGCKCKLVNCSTVKRLIHGKSKV